MSHVEILLSLRTSRNIMNIRFTNLINYNESIHFLKLNILNEHVQVTFAYPVYNPQKTLSDLNLLDLYLEHNLFTLWRC